MSRHSCLSCLLLALVFGGFSASAGELRVTVTDRDGRAMEDVTVRLRLGAGHDASFEKLARFLNLETKTDLEGRASFHVPHLGAYEVHAVPPEGYVDPEANPFARTPRVTFTEPGERLEVVLPLWRGGPLTLEMQVDRGPDDWSGRAEIVGLDGHFTQRVRLRDGLAEELMLVPGRYEIVLIPPPGLLLRDVVTRSRQLPEGRVAIEIEEGWTSRHVTWHVGANARIDGTITYDDEPVGVSPVAVLIAPGPWVDQISDEGGWEIDRVRGRFTDDDGEHFEIFVPDGRWQVMLVGENASVEPESVPVSLAPGSVGYADFRVSEIERSGCRVWVEVESAAGDSWFRGLNGVRVGLWRDEDDPTEVRPLRVEETGGFGTAHFRKLEPGAYRIVARHPGFLDGEETVSARCDRSDDASGNAAIALERGARILFEARSESGDPVKEVRVDAVALEPPKRALLNGNEGRAFERSALTDDSGRGEISGLYKGSYEVTPRMDGRLARQRFVSILDGEEPVESREIFLRPGRDEALDLRVTPAASLEATLYCDDGKKLPDRIAVRAFPQTDPPEPRTTGGDLRRGAELALDDLVLRGGTREELQIGPLQQDLYRIAVRPHGFDRWTWIGSGEDASHAARIQTRLGEVYSSGLVEIACAPRVEIAWPTDHPATPAFVPQLAQARAEFVAHPSGGRAAQVPDIDRDGLSFTGLPEAQGTLHVLVEHPHFLPVPEWELAIDARFRRGGVVESEFPLPELGGAIEVLTQAPAVRIARDVDERIVKTSSGRALIPSLPPGTYQVEVCQDSGCLEAAPVDPSVAVKQGQTTHLDARPGSRGGSHRTRKPELSRH